MEAHFESNPLIDRLPEHLKQFIKPQDYSDYTPINQAVWRYVMRKNVDYLSKVAHSSYLDGLKQWFPTFMCVQLLCVFINCCSHQKWQVLEFCALGRAIGKQFEVFEQF